MLLIDTAGAIGRVAVSVGRELLCATELDATRRHVRDIVPGIRRVCAAIECGLANIDAVAVSTGPGSFTGIRVGISVAKALAYANNCRLIGVSGFDALAQRFQPVGVEVLAMFPGQLGTILAARYALSQPTPSVASFKPDELVSEIVGEVLLTGPAAPATAAQVPGARLGEPPWEPDLADLLAAALRRWDANAFSDAFALEPEYVRPSSAEVKWDARGRT